MEYDVKELLQYYRRLQIQSGDGAVGNRQGETLFGQTIAALTDLEKYREALETVKSDLDDGDIAGAYQTTCAALTDKE